MQPAPFRWLITAAGIRAALGWLLVMLVAVPLSATAAPEGTITVGT